ncbi:MAG: DUF975 family protein [bacterium]
MLWYYAKNGERKGPVEDAEFRHLAGNGTIQPDDLVWQEAFGDTWRPARRVEGLVFSTHVPPMPPAPPPPPGISASLAQAISFSSRTHNRDLMVAARDSLRNRWGLAIGVIVVIGAIQIALSLLAKIPLLGLVFSIGSLLISGALALGVAIFWLSLSRTGTGSMNQAFSGFERFGVAFVTYLLVSIFVLLWLLLLIVPGIIAALRYSQVWFVLADNPQMDALDAINRSKQMMQGNKWKYFCLQWRFFGWGLLCIVTLGIGFLWLCPYIAMSQAKFYDDLKPTL